MGLGSFADINTFFKILFYLVSSISFQISYIKIYTNIKGPEKETFEFRSTILIYISGSDVHMVTNICEAVHT